MIAVRTTVGAAALTALILGLGACTTMKSARDRIVRSPVACADQTAQIYFEESSAEITKESQAVIAAAGQGAKACTVTGVEVLGLADSVGAADASLDLSKRRAAVVIAALAKAGVPQEAVTIAAAGQSGAVTAGGQARPLRRRADVVLHMKPR